MAYVCPECGYEAEEAGTCPDCGVALVEETMETDAGEDVGLGNDELEDDDEW